MAHSIMRLNADQARRRPACIHELERVLMAPVSPDMLECPVKRPALAVLWASYSVTESGLLDATQMVGSRVATRCRRCALLHSHGLP